MLHIVLIWFLDQENVGLDPKIVILHEVISEILEISDFTVAILRKAEMSSESHCFGIMTSKCPLNKCYIHGGSWGDAWRPLIAHGLIYMHFCFDINVKIS